MSTITRAWQIVFLRQIASPHCSWRLISWMMYPRGDAAGAESERRTFLGARKSPAYRSLDGVMGLAQTIEPRMSFWSSVCDYEDCLTDPASFNTEHERRRLVDSVKDETRQNGIDKQKGTARSQRTSETLLRRMFNGSCLQVSISMSESGTKRLRLTRRRSSQFSTSARGRRNRRRLAAKQ